MQYRLIPFKKVQEKIPLSAKISWMAAEDHVYRWTGPVYKDIAPGDFLFKSGVECNESFLADVPDDKDHFISLMTSPRGALLWDQSHMWGVMAYETMTMLGFDLHLVSRQDIESGRLKGFDCLCVPGGVARLKSEQLGETAKDIIREFVDNGGTYIGFCGGAGFCLDVPEGLGLLPVVRRQASERLQNFSGQIEACLHKSGTLSLGLGLDKPVYFNVWWPSQFEIMDKDKVEILSTYGRPGSGFFVSDLNVHDVESSDISWEILEKCYGMNLSPHHILCEPAIISGRFGKGKVFASYFHLETPGDIIGNLALFNLWHSLPDQNRTEKNAYNKKKNKADISLISLSLKIVHGWRVDIHRVIDIGERNLYFAWRTLWLLRWKRGARGFEVNAIYSLIKTLETRLNYCFENGCPHGVDEHCPGCGHVFEKVAELLELVLEFKEFYINFILQDSIKQHCSLDGLQNATESDENGDIEKILFDSSRPAGGLYVTIADRLSNLIYWVIKK